MKGSEVHGGTLQALQTGFDGAAARYDAEMDANPAMRYMRGVSLAVLTGTFQAGEWVLEIGCGTGEEAVALAQRGVRVLATDLSPTMVAHTQAKAEAHGVQELVATEILAASELPRLLERAGKGAFDGAYSSFGPLNGERDLYSIARALASLLRPGGAFVASIMNRYYLFETLWFLAHVRPRQAFRRWRGHALATVSADLDLRVPTWYYTPADVTHAFQGAFRCESCRALPLLLPPPYLDGLWRRAPNLWRRLIPLEEWLAPRRPFCALGDHLHLVLRRR